LIPDFRTAANQIRVKYLWDQGGCCVGGARRFGYGKKFTESQINAGRANQIDNAGHLTYVAGIVAGNATLNALDGGKLSRRRTTSSRRSRARKP